MAHRDLVFTLQPGQQKPVPGSGAEFVFIKECSRPLGVLVNGQRTIMNAGEKTRPGDVIRDMVFENLDDTRPLKVVAVVGTGDYEKIIITGKVSAEPLLKKADGTEHPYSLYEKSLTLNLTDTTVKTYNVGGNPKTAYPGAMDAVFAVDERLFGVKTLEPTVVYEYDPITLQQIGSHEPSFPTVPTTPQRFWQVAQNGVGGQVYGVMNNGSIYEMSLVGDEFVFGGRLSFGGTVQGRGISIDPGDGVIAITDFNFGGKVAVYNLVSGVQVKLIDPVVDMGLANWPEILFIDGYLAVNNGGQGKTEVWDISGTPVQVNHWLDDSAERYPVWCHIPTLKRFYTGNENKIRTWWDQTWSTYGKGFAFVGSGYRLEKAAPVEIETPLTFTLDADGTQLVSGPIISVVLELMNKSYPPPDDYTDAVYGFDTETYTLKSGNSSFLAVGYEDDFTVGTSESITLTLDKDLQF